MSDVEEEENSLFVSEKDIEDRRIQQEEERRLRQEETEAAVEAETQPTNNDTEDEDDPVIQEFPVYFNNSISESLHLYQYPTRSALYPFVDALNTGIINSRVKSSSGVVEVDIPLAKNEYYDPNKASKWQHLDLQTFGGVMKPCRDDGNFNNYMVGVFKDEELHVTPIKSIAQLRPQFKYVDQAVQSEKELNNAMNNKKDSSAAAKGKETTKAVQVTAKASGDNAPRHSGAISSRKAADEEPFVHLEWFDRDSDEAWKTADGLMAKDKSPIDSDMSTYDYMGKLIG